MSLVKAFRQRFISPVLRLYADRLIPPGIRRIDRLGRLADMARWWRSQRDTSIECASRGELHALVRARVTEKAFDYLEFGVAGGESFRWWAAAMPHPEARFTGFDTFEGIPESWGNQPAGSYSTGGVAPQIDDSRATFVIGRFAETLPTFSPEPALRHPLVIHLDADLYSSTATALDWLAPHLEAGDLVVFDQLLDVGTAHEEFAAFVDFDLRGLRYEVIGHVIHGPQVAIRLTGSRSAR